VNSEKLSYLPDLPSKKTGKLTTSLIELKVGPTEIKNYAGLPASVEILLNPPKQNPQNTINTKKTPTQRNPLPTKYTIIN